jgi:hypothetical protein
VVEKQAFEEEEGAAAALRWAMAPGAAAESPREPGPLLPPPAAGQSRDTADNVARLEALLLGVGPDGVARRTRPVAGVPGALVLERLLAPDEAAALCEHVRASHAACGKGGARRESQHPLSSHVRPEALAGLCARAAAALPAVAGPALAQPVLAAPHALSPHIRSYCYLPGDFSTPHFDRTQVGRAADGRVTASAFSVVLYLNEGFSGGCTTFFAPDPSLVRSARGNTVLVPRDALSVAAAVEPRTGDALIFPHGGREGDHPNPLHEGSVILEGCKCILRTDIVFDASPLKPGSKGSNAPRAGKRQRSVDSDGARAAPERAAPERAAPERPSPCELRAELPLGLQLEQEPRAEPRAELLTIAAHLLPAMHAIVGGAIDVAAMLGKGLARAPPNSQGPEARCSLATDVFWALFKAARAEGKGAVAVALPDGARRELASAAELAELLAEQLRPCLAFARPDEHSRGTLLLTSRDYAALQSSRGLSYCDACGKFMRNEGLDEHRRAKHAALGLSQAKPAPPS